mmetsp:Transcript_5552/g.24987  ORF Transcript_5552/g.24987 Transcript_5552/m.24987 type:complete len:291 (+) Transcript_5552:2365-3237(+)
MRLDPNKSLESQKFTRVQARRFVQYPGVARRCGPCGRGGRGGWGYRDGVGAAREARVDAPRPRRRGGCLRRRGFSISIRKLFSDETRARVRRRGDRARYRARQGRRRRVRRRRASPRVTRAGVRACGPGVRGGSAAGSRRRRALIRSGRRRQRYSVDFIRQGAGRRVDARGAARDADARGVAPRRGCTRVCASTRARAGTLGVCVATGRATRGGDCRPGGVLARHVRRAGSRRRRYETRRVRSDGEGGAGRARPGAVIQGWAGASGQGSDGRRSSRAGVPRGPYGDGFVG